MNELLDLLEARVAALLDEVQTLRRDNETLQRDLTDKTDSLARENAELREALTRERDAREAAATRIDGLLQRLTEHTPD